MWEYSFQCGNLQCQQQNGPNQKQLRKRVPGLEEAPVRDRQRRPVQALPLAWPRVLEVSMPRPKGFQESQLKIIT